MRVKKPIDVPLLLCLEQARRRVREMSGSMVVLQKFTCAKCGTRQTMIDANRFYTHGMCEECEHVTDISVSGCNYMIHASNPQALRVQYGNEYTPCDVILVDCNEWVKQQRSKH